MVLHYYLFNIIFFWIIKIQMYARSLSLIGGRGSPNRTGTRDIRPLYKDWHCASPCRVNLGELVWSRVNPGELVWSRLNPDELNWLITIMYSHLFCLRWVYLWWRTLCLLYSARIKMDCHHKYYTPVLIYSFMFCFMLKNVFQCTHLLVSLGYGLLGYRKYNVTNF